MKETSPQKPRLFATGPIVITRAALETLTEKDVRHALARHMRGDWGNVSQEDWQSNDEALNQGCRLLSAWHAANGERFWVITEADRSATTILLPEDY
ncbi:MAG: hypothetical protein U0996_26345 [Planctomycetaceae bacterium]